MSDDIRSRITTGIDAMTRCARMADDTAESIRDAFGAECQDSVSYWHGVAKGRREAVALLRNMLGSLCLPVDVCSDCGEVGEIHPDSDAQRGEPICLSCALLGAFAP